MPTRHHRNPVQAAAAAAATLALILQACSTANAPGAAALPATTAAASSTIQVNQVGFLPGAAKWAVVPAGAAERFDVIDASTGREVFSGRLTPSAHWEPAQESLRLADFSSLRTPGEYRLHVADLPESARFVIGARAYEPVNAAALRAFFFNRAGIELKTEHAGPWARPAGHPDTRVLVHASAAGPGRPAGTVISAPKGWYDAGDYNKYIVNSGITTYTLLAAWEHFPAHFAHQRLNIPESGNALPDLLDEVLWNLEWMLAMQDPADGGVYHKLTDKGFDGVVMPHVPKNERYVVMKSTAATLDFAAVAAQASRVFVAFEAQRPGLSARLLAASKAAWGWAQAHPAVVYQQPADIHTGGYDDRKLGDEFAWAAAELYVTTRDDAYLAALKAQAPPAGVPGWGDVGSLAWITLAHHRERLTPAADRAEIARQITTLAGKLAAQWQASAYRVAMQRDDFYWGSNAVALNQALMLIQGYRVSGDRRQLDAAQAALDFVLGRHPTGFSMVTGFGERSPREPHHRPSGADGVTDPVPGFIVGGPRHEDSDDCKPMSYPSKAAAKAWLDRFCSYTTNEVAINWNAPLVYVSAALQALTPAAKP
ncbi:glycoside hydrolase family 9 protein [Aquincola sp. S2]|uniref:Endoglucanase n=1 Tax=Pseudaquabacterium terrae TaxID=2732868 RepID=A0ABX2ESE7_9BURK|nr:glycoside hydrolase family 9 protein [Aquabacterium terrae]NRF71670.1 glycoside hydrolase family 9 protein [Aquabacterium terrae]